MEDDNDYDDDDANIVKANTTNGGNGNVSTIKFTVV